MHARLVCAALLSLALIACNKTQPTQDATPLPPVEPCPFVYIYAPGNYIVDIASGSQVILDPGVQEFDLFCSPGPRQLWGSVANQMPISVALNSGTDSLVFSIG